MTLRIPGQAILVVLTVLVSWGGAFAIAIFITGEDHSDYINCTNDALQRNAEESEKLERTRPESPDSPGAGGSSASYDAYEQQFRQYERDSDRYRELGDEITRTYAEDVRACEELL